MEVVAVSMLVGATLMAAAPTWPGPAGAWAVLALGLALAIVVRTRWPGWMLVGAGWFALVAGAALSDRPASSTGGVDVTLTGRIVDVPRVSAENLRFVFEPDLESRPTAVPSRLLLSWYEPPMVPDPALRWRLRVRIRPPAGLANPGGFDFERWLLERRIGATGYVRRSADNGPLGPAGAHAWLTGVRQEAAAAVDRILGATRAGGIVKAITLGVRAGLDEDTRTTLRETGTAHLMAISGLHVGMVAGLGALLGRWMWAGVWRLPGMAARGVGRRPCAALVGWLAAGAYTLLAGAGVPARRALIMLSAALFMLAWRRRFGPAMPLAAAAIALFAVDPLCVLSAGFWLSITAVAGLVVAGTGGIGRPGRLRQLAAAQWAVSWALCLPGLMVFGGLPLYGPLVNLVAVPLFGLVVVPLALAGLLALAFSERLAASLWRLLAPILEGFLDGLEAVAEMPGAWQQPATVPGWALAVAGMAALALLLPFGRLVRFAWLLVLVPVLWWRPSALPAGAYRVTVLDVGQGLAVVVETRRRVLVFDTGPAWRSGRDAGAAVVVPFLRGAGIEQVDALVLSHGDGDHRGGAASIEQRIRVDRRWVGPDAANVYPAGPDVRPCAAGVNWRWDGVRFRFLHPSAGARVRGNDSSCVLRVEGPGGRTLLTGDIEAPGEAALLAERARLATDLLVAPHHGSRTSSTAPFVAATAPRWVVFPAGFGNRWGFPAAEVRARWQRAGAGLWTTGEDGAVQVEFASAGVAGPPTGWRCRAPRAWRRARCATDAGRDRVPGAGDSQYDSADPVPRLSGP